MDWREVLGWYAGTGDPRVDLEVCELVLVDPVVSDEYLYVPPGESLPMIGGRVSADDEVAVYWVESWRFVGADAD